MAAPQSLGDMSDLKDLILDMKTPDEGTEAAPGGVEEVVVQQQEAGRVIEAIPWGRDDWVSKFSSSCSITLKI